MIVSPRQAVLIKWLRVTHAWFGLWGAVLGLVFGVSGVLLNHRSILKLPLAATQDVSAQLPMPGAPPASAEAWGRWLQQELALERAPTRVRVEPARPVEWSADRALEQPARWQATFAGPRDSVAVDWWQGTSHATVKRTHHNAWSTLANLHKGTGMDVGWILLVDTLAGSIILLSLSGVLMWTQLNRKRLVGVALFGGSLTWLVVSLAGAL
jgi:hypothetical protein